jgi:hypothetical protein
MPYITAGPSKPKSVLGLFLLYKKEQENDEKFKKDVNLLQSVFVRFVVPGWSGPTPKGARATPKEVASADFSQQVFKSRLRKDCR